MGVHSVVDDLGKENLSKPLNPAAGSSSGGLIQDLVGCRNLGIAGTQSKI